MKLLLLTENWPPRIGGIENYLTNIVKHLPKKSVDVVEPSMRRFFWPLIKPAWLPLYLWLYRKAKREEYQVTLCGKALFEGQVGYYLMKKLGIPYIVFTYAMEIETWRDNKRQEMQLEKVLLKADRVAYINEETKESLLDIGVKEQQLLKLWPGVDSSFLEAPAQDKMDSVLNENNVKRPYILTIARLIERKGIDSLIEAFSKLDQMKFEEVQLVVVGDGPELEELKHQAEKMWVDTSVKFLGEVDDGSLKALLAAAKVFALTPRQIEDDMEGFGIVYLEAAASGIPVVGSKTGGVSEAVIDNDTGILVKSGSTDETAEALERLLGDKKLREKLGQAGRERVISSFTWPTRIEPLKRAIDELVRKQV